MLVVLIKKSKLNDNKRSAELNKCSKIFYSMDEKQFNKKSDKKKLNLN